MSTRANHAAIGAFVLGALVILAIAIAVFFGEGWGKSRYRAVMVFDGNVAGLDVGTPVEFRGVPIGEVKRIRAIYDTSARQPRFAVYAQLTAAVEIDGAKTRDATEHREWLEVMIEQGLRARLETKSYVTGQQRVMLDFFPETTAAMTGIDPGLPEIPTVRSPGEELIAELREIPFRQIILEVRKLLQSVQHVLENPDGTPGPLPVLLADVSRLSRSLEGQVPPLARELRQAATDARAMMQQGRAALEEGRGVIQEGRVALQEGRVALQDARGAIPDARNALVETQGAMADARRLIAETQSIVKEARSVVVAAEQAVKTADRRIDSGGEAIEGAAAAARDAGNQIRALAQRLEGTIENLNRTLARIDHTFSDDSPLAATIGETMREIGGAAHSLRTAAELFQRRPESLIRGRSDVSPMPEQGQ